jgi:predicted nuclease with TOPRIM domain
LLKEYTSAQKEIQRLQKENNRLNELLQSYNNKTKKLNQKEDLLKMSVENLTNQSKKDLEKRIDSYLKDIDKCLALLHS